MAGDESNRTLLIDTDEYRAILKKNLHQACVAVALSRASTVKVEGSSAKVENQALQSDPMFKIPQIQEQGELDASISVVSTTQKMSGTRVRQSIAGTNDRCTVMGKVPPNEYPFSGVPVANDPVDYFDGILGDSVVGNLMASTLYFVHWYSVRFDNPSKTFTLDYLGSELFNSSSIVCSCCNPRMPEESVVLLENGALFLFDLASYVNCQKLNG
ncbi:hypothetical protein PVK06_041268 [Gossypium arboreum]|uniref:Uncharacterized protein n=1 Tax=Gossypium arboreum TaxID=29729 RepID=A0ABR0N9Y5_GOSAR|nr:hypothetical protein PVK06_041268 [Gossypium arboreum]